MIRWGPPLMTNVLPDLQPFNRIVTTTSYPLLRRDEADSFNLRGETIF